MEELIFGRYTREECGLPPETPRRIGWRKLFARSLLLVAGLVLAGWLGGAYAVRWRENWMNSLPAAVQQADAAEAHALLSRGRLYATAQPDNTRMRQDLALALLVRAERAPRRLGYYGNIAAMYRDAPWTPGANPQVDFAAELSASGVFAELEEYEQAFACLSRAEEALSRYEDEQLKRGHRLLLLNARAYYLATAPIREGGNPEKALHLAQLAITSRDELPGGGHVSEQAAFLDTLASAWYATGDAEKAVETQRLALGLANDGGLDVYVANFDKFQAALPPQTRK